LTFGAGPVWPQWGHCSMESENWFPQASQALVFIETSLYPRPPSGGNAGCAGPRQRLPGSQ